METKFDRICPICRGRNQCQIADGELYKGQCWCFEMDISHGLAQLLSEHIPNTSCVCKCCYKTISTIEKRNKKLTSEEVFLKIMKKFKENNKNKQIKEIMENR